MYFGWLELILYSKHAREKMIERGISVNEVEEGLRKGASELQPPNKVLYNYTYFTIVTRKVQDNIYIITVKPRW